MLNATIAGNVGKDAQTRSAGSSTVTSWSVAVEQRGKDGKKTQWVNCSLWGARGEKIAQYIKKGSRICAAGELTTREYNDKTYLELNVQDFTFMGGGGQSADAPREAPAPAGNLDDEIPF